MPSVAVGTGLTNYTITYVNGTLTVNPVALTITANNATKVYGQLTLTFLGTEFTTAGLLTGNTVTGVTLASAGATATAAVGSYPITASAAVGTGLTNYTITYVPGTMTVGKATLTIRAAQYSDASPTLAHAYSGFKNGELLGTSGVTGSPSCSTTRTTSSPAGSYPINCGIGLLSATNYAFAFVSGIFSVTQENAAVEYTGDSHRPGRGRP